MTKYRNKDKKIDLKSQVKCKYWSVDYGCAIHFWVYGSEH